MELEPKMQTSQFKTTRLSLVEEADFKATEKILRTAETKFLNTKYFA